MELTATCNSAKVVRDKLVSIYEQSSGQLVNRPMEKNFGGEQLNNEDIAPYRVIVTKFSRIK